MGSSPFTTAPVAAAMAEGASITESNEPPASAEELLGALVGDDPGLRQFKEMLIERTEGNPFFLEEILPGDRQGPSKAICCAPLYFRDRLVGALTIYALLSHKASFSQLDRELFDLLGEQAALAMVSSQAYVAVERKLKTVQRFMDLLKT